jgi:hypothetical protein
MDVALVHGPFDNPDAAVADIGEKFENPGHRSDRPSATYTV